MLSRSESGNSDSGACVKNGLQSGSHAKGERCSGPGQPRRARGRATPRLGEWLESAGVSATRCRQKFRDVQIETRQGIEMERC